MNFAYYISKRIRSKKQTTFSGTIHGVAIFSISIGITAMIVSFLILGGFKTKINEKIFSFGGHLQVKKFSFKNSSYEEEPISILNKLNQQAHQLSYVDHIQPFASKPGLIKANEDVMGVVVKGVNSQFDFARFSENMVAGRMLHFSDTADAREIIISTKISQLMHLRLNDEILIYFMGDPVRVRRLEIVGMYETGMEDFDEKIVIGDLKTVQKLNNWSDDMVGGFEIFLEDFRHIDKAYQYLDEDVLEPNLYLEKITDVFLEIFDWLKLLDKNVYILIFFILLVACINMTSILLILIMERTQMIGMLKALGCTNKDIRKIFIFNGMSLTLKGLFFGNALAIGLGILQYRFKLIRLDPENYYMSYVPIQWDIATIIGINLLAFTIISLVLIVPAIIISNVSPIKSIRFD